ncbi:DUF799 domain-containing protein [Methylophaga muralis]|jgi:hypothetical protein|uniref:Putative lipoprotein n=1 Tax=Methylophaga muralis TaxID=291169 RepID=A0A1E3GNA5_9GAMM|nr:GNA1162 family protein [Methylophaga muralis]ODN65514.1 putative lipoprotein precursor [Methylophaga muralis]
MMIKRTFLLLPLVMVAMLTGCATTEPYNYDALLAAKPRSILVVPPLNESLEVNASYIDLSTLSRPLAEKGYYVFPVAVIESFMKENGLPTPDEMNQVPLDKLHENTGADAVLYTRISDWGQKYTLLDSSTVVISHVKLVDARTGALLWDADASAVQSGSGNSGGLLEALVAAAITQIIGDMTDMTPSVARLANAQAINNTQRGLLNGPYAPPQHPQ